MDLDALLKSIPGILIVIMPLPMLRKVKIHFGFPLIERISSAISIEKARILLRVRRKAILGHKNSALSLKFIIHLGFLCKEAMGHLIHYLPTVSVRVIQ